MTRQVSADVAFRVARTSLGRMACDVGDVTDKNHDHTECILDPEAYIADRQLRLLAAVAGGDDDTILARLEDLQGSIDTGG